MDNDDIVEILCIFGRSNLSLLQTGGLKSSHLFLNVYVRHKKSQTRIQDKEERLNMTETIR